MIISQKVLSVVILQGSGADKVMIEIDQKEACWPYTGKLVLEFSAAAGTGPAYVQNTFGFAFSQCTVIRI